MKRWFILEVELTLATIFHLLLIITGFGIRYTYKQNDSITSPSSFNSLKNSNPYILFYIKKEKEINLINNSVKTNQNLNLSVKNNISVKSLFEIKPKEKTELKQVNDLNKEPDINVNLDKTDSINIKNEVILEELTHSEKSNADYNEAKLDKSDFGFNMENIVFSGKSKFRKLIKLAKFCNKINLNIFDHEDDNVNLDPFSKLKNQFLNKNKKNEVNQILNSNKLIFEKVIKQKDEYDKEYDKGKMKKIKKPKVKSNINFQTIYQNKIV